MARTRKIDNTTDTETNKEVKQDKLITVTLKDNYCPKYIVYMKRQFVVFENGKADVTNDVANELKEMGLI